MVIMQSWDHMAAVAILVTFITVVHMPPSLQQKSPQYRGVHMCKTVDFYEAHQNDPCCSGWSQTFPGGPCLKPVCKTPCGPGRCIAPSQCLCRNGQKAVTCISQPAHRRIIPTIPRTCSNKVPKCSQKCHMSRGIPRCSCIVGFALSIDGVSCSDVNECYRTRNGGCDQRCMNTQGSFMCTCFSGYTLGSDGRTCRRMGDYSNSRCKGGGTPSPNGNGCVDPNGSPCTDNTCDTTVEASPVRDQEVQPWRRMKPFNGHQQDPRRNSGGIHAQSRRVLEPGYQQSINGGRLSAVLSVPTQSRVHYIRNPSVRDRSNINPNNQQPSIQTSVRVQPPSGVSGFSSGTGNLGYVQSHSNGRISSTLFVPPQNTGPNVYNQPRVQSQFHGRQPHSQARGYSQSASGGRLSATLVVPSQRTVYGIGNPSAGQQPTRNQPHSQARGYSQSASGGRLSATLVVPSQRTVYGIGNPSGGQQPTRNQQVVRNYPNYNRQSVDTRHVPVVNSHGRPYTRQSIPRALGPSYTQRVVNGHLRARLIVPQQNSIQYVQTARDRSRSLPNIRQSSVSFSSRGGYTQGQQRKVLDRTVIMPPTSGVNPPLYDRADVQWLFQGSDRSRFRGTPCTGQSCASSASSHRPCDGLDCTGGGGSDPLCTDGGCSQPFPDSLQPCSGNDCTGIGSPLPHGQNVFQNPSDTDQPCLNSDCGHESLCHDGVCSGRHRSASNQHLNNRQRNQRPNNGRPSSGQSRFIDKFSGASGQQPKKSSPPTERSSFINMFGRKAPVVTEQPKVRRPSAETYGFVNMFGKDVRSEHRPAPVNGLVHGGQPCQNGGCVDGIQSFHNAELPCGSLGCPDSGEHGVPFGPLPQGSICSDSRCTDADTSSVNGHTPCSGHDCGQPCDHNDCGLSHVPQDKPCSGSECGNQPCLNGDCNGPQPCVGQDCFNQQPCLNGDCNGPQPCVGQDCFNQQPCLNGDCNGPQPCVGPDCFNQQPCLNGDCNGPQPCVGQDCFNQQPCLNGDCNGHQPCVGPDCFNQQPCLNGDCNGPQPCEGQDCGNQQLCLNGDCNGHQPCVGQDCRNQQPCLNGDCNGHQPCVGQDCRNQQPCLNGDCNGHQPCTGLGCDSQQPCSGNNCQQQPDLQCPPGWVAVHVPSGSVCQKKSNTGEPTNTVTQDKPTCPQGMVPTETQRGTECTPIQIETTNIKTCPPGRVRIDGVCKSVGSDEPAKCANGGTMTAIGCMCKQGITGKNCQEDVNECEFLTDLCEHRCQNSFGGYKCTCPAGSTLNSDGRSCKKIECFPDCQNGGRCINGACHCKPGFKGPSCQMDVDECFEQDKMCSDICRNTHGSYACLCPPGKRLRSDKRSCMDATCTPECKNGGRCEDGRCQCPTGFYGFICQLDVNECRTDNPCTHECRNTPGSYSCSCPGGLVLEEDGKSCKNSTVPITRN